MKIIIDTDKKELGAEDVINMVQLYEFLKEHGLLDYGLMGVKSDGPSVFPVKFIPADDPLAPPYKITCTDPIGFPRRIIGMREDDIEPMTPEDAFQ